jgi:hypothetical protein
VGEWVARTLGNGRGNFWSRPWARVRPRVNVGRGTWKNQVRYRGHAQTFGRDEGKIRLGFWGFCTGLDLVFGGPALFCMGP